MSLDKKYNRTDLVRVLGDLGDAINPDNPMQFDTYGSNQKTIPLCYQKNNTLIFSPVTDVKGNPPQMRSIEETLAEANKKKSGDIQTLIFPVAEIRLNRKHWVTLHYDILSETATLIDSRPSYISFWYPTGAMKEALSQNGFKVSRFNTIYQGVQHDDTHCGAWTAANILALAEDKTPVAEMANRFSAYDKCNLVNHNIERINPDTVPTAYQPLKTTFIQRHKGKLSLLAGTASFLLVGGLLAATGGLAALPLAALMLGGMTALTGGLIAAGIIGAGLMVTGGAALLLGAGLRKLSNHHPQGMQTAINATTISDSKTNISYGTLNDQLGIAGQNDYKPNKDNLETVNPSSQSKNKQTDDGFEMIGDEYGAENQRTNDDSEDYGFIPGYQQQ